MVAQRLLKTEDGETLFASFSRPFPKADFFMHFGCLLAPSLQAILAQLMGNKSEDQKLLCKLAKRQFQLVLDNQADKLIK